MKRLLDIDPMIPVVICWITIAFIIGWAALR